MKRFYAIAILILSALTLRALQVDTVAMQQLIASGQRALCTAIEHNNTLRKAGATTGYRFFVTPDPPVQTNARVEFVGAQKGSTIPQSVIDTLNARCARDYVQFGVELFLIHINSLDVIVNGQMPQTVNLRDLLVNGLYDEQSNLDSLRKLHKEISSRIVSGVALSLNRTSLFYIVGDYCGVFTPTGKEGCWRYARVSSFAGPGQIGDHAGEFRDNLFRRVENIGSMLLPDRLLAVENEFRESMTVYNQRQLITSSFHPNFLNAIFENFDADAFADLTLEQRLHALHVYSGYPMLSAWFGANSEEHFVLQIIKTAPPDQAKGLLQGMEAPSTAIEGSNAYTGTKNGEALIYKLVDRTDDAIVAGPNNYQLLMKYVSATCTKSPQAIDYCVAATDVAQFNTVINWKNNDLLAVPPVGHIKYFVDFLSNGKVSYTFQNVLGYGNTPGPSGPTTTTLWSQSSTPIELSPFSFIILNNTSGLSMIGDVMNGPGAQMVPAVMLKYCADKQFNDQAITACAVALDIVGVVTGPGLITAALRAGRLAVAAFEAVQLLGAVGNLVANSSASPNLQAVINKYNAIVGIWGLTRIATSGARYTADYFTAAKQNNLATISETAAQEYEVLYNTAKTDIDAAPEAVKGPLDKMKQLMGKGVSGGGDLSWLDDLVGVLPSGAKAKITSWVDEGLDGVTLKNAFNSSADKSGLYNRLNSSKGINHQRAIIDDYVNIPGVTQGSFVSNAVDNVTSNIVKNVNNKQFTLYPGQAKTFVKNASLSVRNSIEVIEDLGNGIQFIKIKPETKLYRVFDGYKPWDDISMSGNTLPNGSFWTFEKPNLVSDVIEGTAVMPEWNGMTKIIEIEVPPTGLYGWYGKAARQPASSNTTSFYLKGGEEQIVINFGQNQQSISSVATSITSAPWIK